MEAPLEQLPWQAESKESLENFLLGDLDSSESRSAEQADADAHDDCRRQGRVRRPPQAVLASCSLQK